MIDIRMSSPTDMFEDLLAWDVLSAMMNIGKADQGLANEQCNPIPDRFLNEKEYVDAFRRPALLEMKASVLQSIATDSIPSYSISLSVTGQENSGKSTVEAVARFTIPTDKRDWTAPIVPADTLCILTSRRELIASPTMCIGVVMSGKILGCVRLRVKVSQLTFSTSDLYMHPIQSMVSAHRELEALESVRSIDLKDEILLGIANSEPRIPNITKLLSLHRLPDMLMDSFGRKLNPAQKQVIDTLCDLNLVSGSTVLNPPKIVLVRGPPGTGKTMTLNAVLNALHVQQYNAYYRSIVDAVRSGRIMLNNERSWLDLTKVAKPRIIVCAPSNVAIDNIILRIQSEKFLDGHCTPYVPRLVRIGKGATSNTAVAETALSRLVENLTSETGTQVADKIKKLESLYSEYRHGVVVQVSKLGCMIMGTPHVFRAGIETRVTTNVQGLLVPYWADHIAKTTTSELPPPASADEPPGKSLEEMEEYAVYAQELMRFLELWEETHWKLQRYRLVQSFIQESVMSSKQYSNNFEKYQLQQSLETLFMNEASIVCGTLNSTGLPQVRDSSPFQTCVVDEAAQAVELSTLIPLRLGVKKLVLIGDPQQLPATVLCKRELLGGNYERSLFERLEICGVPVHTLNLQYRMHPAISQFPRKIFYETVLGDAESVLRRPPPFFTLPPWNLNPFVFVDVVGARESTGSASKSNMVEAQVCLGLYNALVRMAGSVTLPLSVGIISPYADQVRVLRETFSNSPQIEIATVDSFQGKEKEIIILSTVRAAPESNTVGFLADMRRMNVAITRAKMGLFIVGRADTLAVNPTWAQLVQSAKQTHNGYIAIPPGAKDVFEIMAGKFFRNG